MLASDVRQQNLALSCVTCRGVDGCGIALASVRIDILPRRQHKSDAVVHAFTLSVAVAQAAEPQGWPLYLLAGHQPHKKEG